MREQKVIRLDRTRIPAEPRRNDHICRHRLVLVCEKTRMLECKACGQVIEPFDFMWQWANRDRNLEHTREAMKRDVERLTRELEDLKTDEKNTRARLKRLKEQQGSV
jgi:transcription initiation factor TFIIIB Brf1 subunit/transcription initiation factor TFIIB